jgi:hypothetical protein
MADISQTKVNAGITSACLHVDLLNILRSIGLTREQFMDFARQCWRTPNVVVCQAKRMCVALKSLIINHSQCRLRCLATIYLPGLDLRSSYSPADFI